ncbi:MAG: hypothetical protein M0R33_22520 [Methylomonas sp.]|jgi:type IV pili sensor histidine kinase/response regulator|uniref:PFGI-1 class ICE element type IV pilus protein PilL2 n=1 Tax=Methylomonas sp. TaxID=418 RepID=UPI0025F4F29D|nr:hypothetical protein [Methylomonas sp.]MCK9609220.1 hypothetical protein [Methylomonas sp.]
MNPNALQPAVLIVLPILLVTLAGCTPIKSEQNSLIASEDSKGSRIDPNHNPQAAAEAKLLPIYQKSTANRAALIVQAGRYSAVTATPLQAQRYPLDVIIDVTIPEACISIEQAIRFLLRRSGYELDAPVQAEVVELLTKPLPAVHRKLGPMPLKDALTLLVTPCFVLQDEPIKRLIRFSPITENRGGL